MIHCRLGTLLRQPGEVSLAYSEGSSVVVPEETGGKILPPIPMRKVTPEVVYASVAPGELVPASRPTWDQPAMAACEQMYEQFVLPGTGEWVPDHAFLDLPRWVFLEYLVHFRGLLARGANAPDLDPVRPGLPSRNILGWDSPRCYAYTSGLQAIFFAILDRNRLQTLAAAPYASTLHLPGSVPGAGGCP